MNTVTQDQEFDNLLKEIELRKSEKAIDARRERQITSGKLRFSATQPCRCCNVVGFVEIIKQDNFKGGFMEQLTCKAPGCPLKQATIQAERYETFDIEKDWGVTQHPDWPGLVENR